MPTRNEKNVVYKLLLSFDSTFHVNSASCGCPAGMGPTGSCKHIGALCYAFANFCEMGSIPDYLTCTERLSTWNQPKGPKVTPIPVEELCSRRNEIADKCATSSVVFDPRHPNYQTSDTNSAEILRCDLLNKCRDVNPALLTILVPSTAKISHDHTYAKQSDVFTSDEGNNDTVPQENNDTVQEEIQHYFVKCYEDTLISKILNSLQLTSEQRQSLEEQTRSQSDSCLWHYARAYCITGSKCGQILLQKDKLRLCFGLFYIQNHLM